MRFPTYLDFFGESNSGQEFPLGFAIIPSTLLSVLDWALFFLFSTACGTTFLLPVHHLARPDRIRMLQVQGPSFNPINVWSLIHNYDVLSHFGLSFLFIIMMHFESMIK